MEKPKSVVRPWVAGYCTWKQQTVLFSALRGCDGRPKKDPSNVFKKRMRDAVLFNADASTGFLSEGSFLDEESRQEIRDFFTGCLDSYPMHFILHLLHAAEIVGYKIPYRETAAYWRYFYTVGVQAMHLNEESERQMDDRLADKTEELRNEKKN